MAGACHLCVESCVRGQTHAEQYLKQVRLLVLPKYPESTECSSNISHERLNGGIPMVIANAISQVHITPLPGPDYIWILTIFPSLGRAINTENQVFILYRNRNWTKTWKGTEWKMNQKTDSKGQLHHRQTSEFQ